MVLEKGKAKKYKRDVVVNLVFKENVLAARDYIVRVCTSTWWGWIIGSRSFFLGDRKSVGCQVEMDIQKRLEESYRKI